MLSSSNNAVPVKEEEEEVATGQQTLLAWGRRRRRSSHKAIPCLYLSYGLVAMKGMRPALTDVLEAAPSFTELSPPLGQLDFFGMLEGHSLGAASGECDRLLALLRDSIAGQVNRELLIDSPSPRFLDRTSRFRWWATTLGEAFSAFHEEVTACSRAEHGQDAPAATAASAIIALVLEEFVVIGNFGATKAVLSCDGQLVDLCYHSLDTVHARETRGDENKSGEKCVLKLATSPRTTTDASVSPVPAPATATEVAVDVLVVDRDARDEFLVLACAAIWDNVSPAAACAHVRQRLQGRTLRVTMPSGTHIASAEGSPTLLAEGLAKKALDAGSQDNVSVGIVLFRDFWSGHDRSDQARSKRTRRPNSMVYGPMWQN